MSNMSYCRWQNTFNDLRDCAGDLEERMSGDDHSPLSRGERQAAENTLATAAQMFAQLGVDVDLDAALAALKGLK